MPNYAVQLFDSTPDGSAGTYMIEFYPPKRTKIYFSKEAFTSDLKERLDCSERFIEGFFSNPSNPKTNNFIMDHPLSDEDVAYFGLQH
jgi:hypothetical protein